MGFLLAKILLLLGLAAVCGALFAYWWFRRHYQDITHEYLRTREEWATWRRRFEDRLAARPEVDLEPLSAQVAALDAAVRDTVHPEPMDLQPVLERLAAIDTTVRAIVLPRTPDAPDLTLINERLTAIEHALFPVQSRLDELESAVRRMHVPASQTLDLSPVLERLRALQTRLENPPTPKAAVREGSRNLLTHAPDGKPDDLKQLKGVGKALERTLHKVGVFYFWQIAEWSPEDVKYVDSKLSTFRGRIERDGWVNQASELAGSPNAAHRPPTEH
jgi:predicted flap endonuclease-1-like 5' DNA nuclease